MGVQKYARNRSAVARTCPCGKNNRDGKFAPFESNPRAGYCHSCSQFVGEKKQIPLTSPQSLPAPSFMPREEVKKTRKVWMHSAFAQWFKKLSPDRSAEVLRMYCVGTYTHKGSVYVVFWQIDVRERVRSGKMMRYHPNGKRFQNQYGTHWIHAAKKLPEYHYSRCLFGEHLLPKFKKKRVGIVESEKTALVLALFFPKTIWLATGGKSNLKFKRDLLNELKGREVTVYPDAGCYEDWQPIAQRQKFKTSSFLENKYQLGLIDKGADLADWLLRKIERETA